MLSGLIAKAADTPHTGQPHWHQIESVRAFALMPAASNCRSWLGRLLLAELERLRSHSFAVLVGTAPVTPRYGAGWRRSIYRRA